MGTQHRRSAVLFTASLAAIAALTACSGGTGGTTDDSYGFAIAEQEPDSPITVWVDASREPIATAFEEDNPDVPIEIETYDGNSGGSDSFRTKIALFDQSGEGWPDVVFSTQTNDTSWAAQDLNGTQAFAAPLNKGYFDQDFLDGFTDGALDPMTVDDTVYGLRNDLAPVVLWYDESLLTEFGYEIPTTWEEYQALERPPRRGAPRATSSVRSATRSAARTSTTGVPQLRSSSLTATPSPPTSQPRTRRP